jgi:hypothetical protein
LLTALAGDGASAQPAPNSRPGLVEINANARVDLAKALTACVAALSDVGGTCDARRIAGDLTLHSTVELSKPNVHILLGPSTIRLDPGASLRVLANEVTIAGAGRRSTTIIVRGGSSIDIGSETVVARGWELRSLGVSAIAGDEPAYGIRLRNAREGRLINAQVRGFSAGIGVLAEADCWSNLVDDTFFSANGTGLAFVGANTNAWVVRTSIFNSNKVGSLIDLGAGRGYGILFTDGTHFEANGVGLELRSGELYQVALTDPYVETFKGEVFVRAAPRAGARLNARVRVGGGVIFAQDSSPFTIDTSAWGGGHYASLSVDGIQVRTSETSLKLVELKGVGSKWMATNVSVVDSVGREQRY